MKKITSYLLIFVLLITPFNVLACPHVDDQGRLHFQFYNDDWTIVTKIYPMEHHLYGREVSMDDTTRLYSQSFGFPMLMSLESHRVMFLFAAGYNTHLIDEVIPDDELQPTVEGINDLLVRGDNFNLNVGLINTFARSNVIRNDDTYQLYYNVFVRRLNDEANRVSEEYLRANQNLNQRELELVVPELLEITAEFNITTHNQLFNTLEINNFYDLIEVQIYSDEEIENVVAINLNQELNSNNLIEVTFDEVNQRYVFEIDEPGIFALINADFDYELFNQTFVYEVETEEDAANLNTILLIAGAGVIVFIILVGLVIKYKNADE